MIGTQRILHAMFSLIWTILWPNQNDCFENLENRITFKFPYESYFFPYTSSNNFFWFYNLGKHEIAHVRRGLGWTFLWPNKKIQLKIKYSK